MDMEGDCFDFDDGLFPEEQKEEPLEQKFDARYEDPAWFLQPGVVDKTQDSKNEVSIVKFKADYHYLKGDMLQALEQYQKMLGLLPKNNIVTKRECYECLARCSVKVGKFCDSIFYSELLQASSKTVEQLTVSLSCLMDINMYSGLYQFSGLYAMKLLRIHRLNAHIWQRLAYILACKSGVSVPSTARLQNMVNNPTILQTCHCDRKYCPLRVTETKKLQYAVCETDSLLVLFCLMMCKYILTSTRGTALGFSADAISNQIIKLDQDIILLTRENTNFNKLDKIVTKHVFGYDKDFKLDSVNSEFVDRGSSKFISTDIEVSFAKVMSVTWGNFNETWFDCILSLSNDAVSS